MAAQGEGDSAAKSKTGESAKSEKNGKSTAREEERKPEDKVENEVEEKEDDEESLKDDLEDDDKEGASGNASASIAKKSFLGNVCTVKTLLDDNMLVPENNALSFEYMGKTFYADLLPNGGIRWTENKQTFSTPSSWVNFCKRTMAADSTASKSISAWSTIKYDGKRLDSYKLRWYRKQKRDFKVNNPQQNAADQVRSDAEPVSFDMSNRTTNLELLNSALNTRESLMSDLYFDEEDPELDKKRNLVKHCDLPLKHLVGSSEPIKLNANQLVRTEPFSSIGRIQPFTVTISTHALLLMDFHCHLTSTEVVGYLAGSWDATTLNLSILQVFPCRIRIDDDQKAKAVQDEVIANIRQRNLSLVGWYHNHYNRAAQPTIKDIECQLNYQLIMCESEVQYLPCVGLICSPYDPHNKDNSSSLIAYWVLPPADEKALEYGKPLHLFYQTTRDSFLTQDLLLEMRLLAHHYMDSEEKIDFNEPYAEAKENKEAAMATSPEPETKESKESAVFTNWDKLQYSIKPNLPSDLQVSTDLTQHQANLQQQALGQFWTFLKGLLIKSPPAPEATAAAAGAAGTAGAVANSPAEAPVSS